MYSIIIFIIIDFLIGHYTFNRVINDGQRHPLPYIAFSGEPNFNFNKYKHNEDGYRGASIKKMSSYNYNILFFGGSTGYNGEPTIPEIIESKLKIIDTKYQVYNLSAVSANHNQHIHKLTQLVSDSSKIDLIIFYGGYNECIAPLYYDPRPGYPFNHYIKELNSTIQFILNNSFTANSLEIKHNLFSNKNTLRTKIGFKSKKYIRSIIDNYRKTLMIGFKQSELITRDKKNNFLAFINPFLTNNEYESTIKEQITNLKNRTEYLKELKSIEKLEFIDDIHLTNDGNKIIGDQIANEIITYINE